MIMFRSSAALMAEDVTVRCRVRKLATSVESGTKAYRLSTKSSFEDDSSIVEMTCTMRNWENGSNGEMRHSLRNTFSLSNPEIPIHTMSNSKIFHSDSALKTSGMDGPELLFTPAYDLSPSKPPRSTNGSVLSSRRISPSALEPYTIPVEEIVLVTCDATAGTPSARSASSKCPNNTRIQVSTVSLGCYEVDCLTSNGHDIVLAFLQGALKPERIERRENKSSSLRKSRHSQRFVSDHVSGEAPSMDSLESSVHSSSVLDIDALQAKHLKGRAEAETWYEKLQRRCGLILSNVSDQWSDGSFCDACCQPSGHSSHDPTTKDGADTGLPSSPTASSPYRTSRRIQPIPLNVTTPPRNSLSGRRHGLTQASLSHGISDKAKSLYNDLEIDDSVTECSPRPTPTRNAGIPPHLPHNSLTLKRPIRHMPSGLSVEPDPYDMESVR